MSETREVKVEFKNKALLAAVIESMGGKILGEGSHHLYAGSVQGFGFTLPKWSYPLVLRESGSLAYDDYKGNWGDITDLERLNLDYVMQTAESVALAQGFYCERVSDALKVHTGEGREVWVFPDGRVEAVGYNGVGCHEACESFASALGGRQDIHVKAEFYSAQVRITQSE